MLRGVVKRAYPGGEVEALVLEGLGHYTRHDCTHSVLELSQQVLGGDEGSVTGVHPGVNGRRERAQQVPIQPA